MRSECPVEFFVNIRRIAISINPSEADLAGRVRSESDLFFLGQRLESCTDKYEKAPLHYTASRTTIRSMRETRGRPF